MSFRADIAVDWGRSPRIITVAAPSTSLDVQDLYDTLRQLAQGLDVLDCPDIVRSEGKGDLGGGVYTGLTVYLLDAKVAFEGRVTATSTGTATSNNTQGRFLTDTSATFVTDGVEAGATIQNLTDGSFATVFEVLSETSLECFPYLTGGSDNQWQIGDSYKIINVDLCKVIGGNLVASDANGDTMDALQPTPNVSFGWTAATAAALLEAGSIAEDVADAVWDEPRTGHTTLGTFGEAVDGIPSAATIAGAVLDEPAASHTDPGSFGKLVDDIYDGLPSVDDIADAVLDEVVAEHTSAGTLGQVTRDMHHARFGGWEIDQVNKQLVYKRPDGTELQRFNLFDKNNLPAVTAVYKRVPT